MHKWMLAAFAALGVGCGPTGGDGEVGDAAPANMDQGPAAPQGGPGGSPAGGACAPLAHHLEARPDAAPTGTCLDQPAADRSLCGEHWFWYALSEAPEARAAAYDVLSGLIDADPGGAPRDLGRLHALRGQLAMALTLEDGDASHLAEIVPDFEAAMALDPSNAIIPTWKDSMDIALDWRLRGGAGLPELMPRAWANLEPCPTGNILSISGTTIGLPMSTGIPQRTVEYLDAWRCDAGTFCEGNTWRAPFAQPGLAYHFAEAYARVGRAADARRHLEAALAAPGADEWPYRPMVADTLADLDAFVAEFEALGPDGDAFDRMYANQRFGCMFCHTVSPPADRVPGGRLGDPRPEPEPEPAPAPEPEPDPEPGDGACTNPDDTAALDAAQDVSLVMGDCALGCFGQGADCPGRCVGDSLGLTDPCAACFGQVLQCTLQHCALTCVDPENAACSACQAEHCLAAFEACAGIRPPG